MAEPVAFFSNRQEILYRHLKDQLFQKQSGVFNRRIVIVPHQSMKLWLSLSLATDPDMGIFSGIEVIFFSQILATLSSIGLKKPEEVNPRQVIRGQELSFLIEKRIREFWYDYEQLGRAGELEVFRPLFDYLSLERGKISRGKEKKLAQLSEKIAGMFALYERYGEKVVSNWDLEKDFCWQAYLWRSIFSCDGFYIPYFEELKKNYFFEGHHANLQVHVFIPEFFSRIDHGFFCHLSSFSSVNYYLLSPCQKFWTDIRSDRQSRGIQNLWRKKGVKEKNLEELEEFLRDRNSLLANFGHFGREFFEILEKGNLPSFENYQLLNALKDCSPYEELIYDDITFEGDKESLSLLEHLQADILLLRNPLPSDLISLECKDLSIQAHAAPSYFREVQVLYDVLVQIVTAHAESDSPILLNDILVVLPNLSLYEPFVHSVFGQKDSLLSYQIVGESLLSKSSLAKGFLKLLSLIGSRWDAPCLFQLLSHPDFRRCHHLSLEQVNEFRKWIQETGVRWGKDESHRKEFLRNEYSLGESLDGGRTSTWEHGIRQLLTGLFMVLPSDICSGQETPYENIEQSQAELFSRFAYLLYSLQEDLQEVESGKYLSLSQWSSYLLCLLEGYFSVDSSQKSEIEAYETLRGKILSLQSTNEELSQEVFSFASIFSKIERFLNDESSGLFEGHFQGVRFGTAKCLSQVPSRVICIMGLNEGRFPRGKKSSIFNKLQGEKSADYYPTPLDEDRYFFLESLLSCREYFILSYLSKEKGGGDSYLPSSLINEVFSYLDSAYTVLGDKPSEACMFEHPDLSFDPSYFQKGAKFSKVCSQQYFQLAQVVCEPFEEEVSTFIPEWLCKNLSLSKKSVSEEAEILVDIQDLFLCMFNPLQVYFNKNLGIYFSPRENNHLKSEEEMVLSHLDHAIFRRQAFVQPVGEVLNRAFGKGKLPAGIFNEIAQKKLAEEVSQWKEHLHQFGTSSEDVFDIELRRGCTKALSLTNGNILLPSLEVMCKGGEKVHLVGHLRSLTPEGILCYGKDSLTDSLKVWPLLLVHQCLYRSGHSFVKSRALFLKDGKVKEFFLEDPRVVLSSLVDYFFICTNHASPMVADLLDSIYSGDSRKLQKKLQGSQMQSIYNEYLKWIMLQNPSFLKNEAVQSWKSCSLGIFNEFFKAWFPKKALRDENHRNMRVG